MQRLTRYKCEKCGEEFARAEDCYKHERACTDRRYYMRQAEKRILKLFSMIEAKDFGVWVRYDTAAAVGELGTKIVHISDLELQHRLLKKQRNKP